MISAMEVRQKETRGHDPAKTADHDQPERLGHLSIADKDVLDSWRRIGKDEGLGTDTDIARYFIKRHNGNRRGALEHSVTCCIRCNTHTALFCSRCSEGAAKPQEHQTLINNDSPQVDLNPQSQTLPARSSALQTTLQNVYICIEPRKPDTVDSHTQTCASFTESPLQDHAYAATAGQTAQSPFKQYGEIKDADEVQSARMSSDACANSGKLKYKVPANSDNIVMATAEMPAVHNHVCEDTGESDCEWVPPGSKEGLDAQTAGSSHYGFQDQTSALSNCDSSSKILVCLGPNTLSHGGDNVQEFASDLHPKEPRCLQDLTPGSSDTGSEGKMPPDKEAGTHTISEGNSCEAKKMGSPKKNQSKRGKNIAKRILKIASDIETDSDAREEDSDYEHQRPYKKKRGNWSAVVCKFCLEVLGSPHDLQHHITMTHTGKMPFQCDLCELAFMSKRKLSCHMTKHKTPDMPYKCSKCSASFMTEHNLDIHLRRRHAGRPCQECGETFKSFELYERHVRREHHKRFICDICGKFLACRQNLLLHIARKHTDVSKHDKEVCVCDVCGISVRNIRRHLKSHSLDRPFSCKSCNATFRQEADWAAHTTKHTGNPDHVCEHCGKGFHQEDGLQRHIKTNHSRSFACPECYAVFGSRSQMTVHSLQHKDRPYKCKVCSFSCFRPSQLNAHNRVHTGDMPFKCDHCPAAFARPDNLNKHKVIHTGATPFSCEGCGSQFRNIFGLRKHIKRHKCKPPDSATCGDRMMVRTVAVFLINPALPSTSDQAMTQFSPKASVTDCPDYCEETEVKTQEVSSALSPNIQQE